MGLSRNLFTVFGLDLVAMSRLYPRSEKEIMEEEQYDREQRLSELEDKISTLKRLEKEIDEVLRSLREPILGTKFENDTVQILEDYACELNNEISDLEHDYNYWESLF